MANGFKTGGRKKGVENKVTTDIRDKFNQLLTENLETISDDLKSLNPKDRINILLQLSKFVIPQLKATEIISNTESESPKINIIYSDDKSNLSDNDINVSFS